MTTPTAQPVETNYVPPQGQRTISYAFVVRADNSLSHHSEVMGNMALFMRQKIMLPDLSIVEVPYVTGDACRHMMRESMSLALLAAIGLTTGLSEGANRLLFNGGMLTGKGNAAVVNLTEYRNLCRLIPHIALFGGCAGNRPIPGTLKVGVLRLLCQETVHLLPDAVLAWIESNKIKLNSCREHIEEEVRVRNDASLDPSKRAFLNAASRAAIEARLAGSEKAAQDGDGAEAEKHKFGMMPRSAEVLAAGSLFSFEVSATVSNPLEEDILRSTIAAWLGGNPYVGGKSGTGHGKLKAIAGFGMPAPLSQQPTQPLDTQALLAPNALGSLFLAHVRAHQKEIRDFLTSNEVNA